MWCYKFINNLRMKTSSAFFVCMSILLLFDLRESWFLDAFISYTILRRTIARVCSIAKLTGLVENKANAWSSKWETKPDNERAISASIIALILHSKINICDWWLERCVIPILQCFEHWAINPSGWYLIQTAVRVDAYGVLTRIKGSISNYLEHTLDAGSVAIGLSYGQSGRCYSTQRPPN